MLSAHDIDAMELDAEQLIDDLFVEWAREHFGSRIPPAEGSLEDAALVRPGGPGPTAGGPEV
jgi:hypothetical protein